MVSLGPQRGESGPHFILHRVWQLLVTAPCTKTGKRLIRTSNTLFALLKVINHCGHRGMVPWVLRSSAECVGVSRVSQHTLSVHMSEMAEVREKDRLVRLDRLARRGKTGRWRKRENKGRKKRAHCTYLFTCMHSRGPVVQSIIRVLSTPTEQRTTVKGNCG